MKNYLPGWPSSSIMARVQDNLLVRPDLTHWSYDRSTAKLQKARNRPTRANQLTEFYLKLMLEGPSK